jgi:two-component system sensor histidine kinase ResE
MTQTHERKHSLLLVDDDDGFRTVLQETLVEEGFHVDAARNGLLGIDAAKTHAYDIIILDIKMPGMDGMEALKILLRESPSSDFMMLTGVHDVGLAVEALKLGVREYFTKPVESDYLVQQIRTTLRARDAEEKIRDLEATYTARLLYELRTPIATIKSGVGFLLKGMAGQLTEQQREVLSHLDVNTGRIVALLNDMIDLSKLETGKVGIEKIAVNFDQFVPAIVNQYEHLAKAGKITLTSRIDENIPTTELDMEKISQVITNLLDNALKYTNEGGTVEFSVKPVEEVEAGAAKQYVLIEVKDSGSGISPEELPYVFDKFKEFLTGKASSKKTTGLGLAICRNIVEAHKGKMTVESIVGTGSTFRAFIPV